MKGVNIYGFCLIRNKLATVLHHCSLWRLLNVSLRHSGLLALSHRNSTQVKNGCWCQQFAERFCCPYADLWNFSSPRHFQEGLAGATVSPVHPVRPPGLTHKAALSKQHLECQRRPCPDPPSHSVTSLARLEGFLTKDGVDSTGRPCLDNMSDIWGVVKSAKTQLDVYMCGGVQHIHI